MAVPIYETSDLVALYDAERNIPIVTYRSTLTPTVTAAAYEWLRELLDNIDASMVHGCIFDFRQVKAFQVGNTQSARQESSGLNQKYDLSRIPVALLVDTLYQEEMVIQSMRFNPQQNRLKILRDEAAAHDFFTAFHAAVKA